MSNSNQSLFQKPKAYQPMSSALIAQSLGGIKPTLIKSLPDSDNTAYALLLRVWLAKIEGFFLLNHNAKNTETTDTTSNSSTGMTHKPKAGFFDVNNSFKLTMRDIELTASRLLKIKHFLESEVEHDPAFIRDLVKLADRLGRQLSHLEQKFYAVSKQQTPTKEQTEQLSSAARLKMEVQRLIELRQAPQLPFHPVPRLVR